MIMFLVSLRPIRCQATRDTVHGSFDLARHPAHTHIDLECREETPTKNQSNANDGRLSRSIVRSINRSDE